MADYSWLDLMRACRASGFEYGKGLITAFAVSAGENTSRVLTAVFVNNDQWHSRDRGPWQINDHWHPEVTDEEAFDLAISTDEAYRISNQGSSFSPWSAYSNGRYKLFMDLGYATYALDNALADVADAKEALAAEAKLFDDCQAQHAIDVQALTAANAQAATLQAKVDKALAALTA